MPWMTPNTADTEAILAEAADTADVAAEGTVVEGTVGEGTEGEGTEAGAGEVGTAGTGAAGGATTDAGAGAALLPVKRRRLRLTTN